MKTNVLLIGSIILNLALGIILFTCCFDKKSHESGETAYPLPGLTSHQDSLKAAIKNVHRFINTFDSAGTNNIVRAYTISSVDMLQVLGVNPETIRSNYDSCRAYLGYDENNLFRLYLTPIKNNRDVFLNFQSSRGGTGAPNGSSYVMDLIAPCPNTCDSLSVLYKGVMR